MGIDIEKRDIFDLSFVTRSAKNQMRNWKIEKKYWFYKSIISSPFPSQLMNIQWIFQSWFGPLVIYSTAHFSVIFRIILHTFNFSPFHLVGRVAVSTITSFEYQKEGWVRLIIKKEHHSIGHKLSPHNGALIKIWHMNFKVSTLLWMRILILYYYTQVLKIYYVTKFTFLNVPTSF